jgi:translation initiation factor 3 subunit B
MGFANTIVVDNLPAVPPEKFDKLEGVIRNIFSRAGTIKEGGFWMPVNADTNMTYGYCFIEYNTTQVVRYCQSYFVFLSAFLNDAIA